jgi:hypothetical protein
MSLWGSAGGAPVIPLETAWDLASLEENSSAPCCWLALEQCARRFLEDA